MPFSVFLEHFLPRAHVKVLGKFDVLGVSVILEKKSSERVQYKHTVVNCAIFSRKYSKCATILMVHCYNINAYNAYVFNITNIQCM